MFTRSGGVWTQQGDKLVGTGAAGNAGQGYSVALSGDGYTAIVGGPGDKTDVGATWVFASKIVRDLDGDHESDILWRHIDGDVAIWEMNGTTPKSETDLGHVDTAWQIAGTSSLVQSTGDFDGDHKTDILWRNSDGGVGIWLMNGTTPTAQIGLGTVDPAWQIAGVGDLDGDGKADIVWRHSNGDVAVWLMNGTTPVITSLISAMSIRSGRSSALAISMATVKRTSSGVTAVAI